MPVNHHLNEKRKFERRNYSQTFKNPLNEGISTLDKPNCSKCNKNHARECMIEHLQ